MGNEEGVAGSENMKMQIGCERGSEPLFFASLPMNQDDRLD